MAVTLVQKRGALIASSGSAVMPTWSPATTAGNLLLLVINQSITGSAAAWTGNPPTGYTGVPSSEFRYSNGTTSGFFGVFWKIAVGADPTPSAVSGASAASWQVYSYEFNASGGWLASAFDTEAHSALTATATTSKASGSTAVLAQADELAVAVMGAAGGVVTALTFSNSFVNELPATNSGALWVGWKETAATTAVSTTASWTTSRLAGVRVATFKAAAAGTLFTKTVTGAAVFAGIKPKVALGTTRTGVLSFSGSEVAHPTARKVTASFTPSGVLARQLTLLRTVTAALSFSGSVARATTYARSLVGAVFAPTGVNTRVKAVSKAVSGALSFVGSSSRRASKSLSGALMLIGGATRVAILGRVVTGSLGLAGVVKKSTNRKVTAILSPTVQFIASLPTSRLFASFLPSGAVTNAFAGRLFSAVLLPASNLARFTTRQLVASLVASGVMHSQYLPPGPLSPPGGGGFGALMSDGFFQRYRVDGKWRGVKRVKA